MATKTIELASGDALSELSKNFGTQNIFPTSWTYSSRTISGITFTVNDDHSISFYGTAASATAAGVSFLLATNVSIEAGNYTLSGCSGGSADSYCILIHCPTSVRQMDDAVNLTVSEATTYNAIVYIKNGFTIAESSPVTVYPCLERGSTAHEYASPRDNYIGLIERIEQLEALLNVEAVTASDADAE